MKIHVRAKFVRLASTSRNSDENPDFCPLSDVSTQEFLLIRDELLQQAELPVGTPVCGSTRCGRLGDVDMSYLLVRSAMGHELTGTFSVPSCQHGMFVLIISAPPTPAGEALFKWRFERAQPLAGQILDDKPSLPLD